MKIDSTTTDEERARYQVPPLQELLKQHSMQQVFKAALADIINLLDLFRGIRMIRDFREADFVDCQKLVNKVWEFDKHFHPPELSGLFQKIYTGGSLAASNFLRVVDENGQVKGFIFGKIENKKIPKSEYSGFFGQLKIIFSLFLIPKVTFKTKLSYLNKINTHEINRRKVESRECSEVNLFVVDPACQGKGWGKKLINEFIEACRHENISRIVLETDAESNFGFYQHLGFSIKGSFHSPLLQAFTGTTGKTYIYELNRYQK